MKTALHRTKLMIYKCYNINKSIPKGYGIYSSDYNHWYKQKTILLTKIIENIQKFSLPIKYGMNNDIIYFSFNDRQFSFHVINWNKTIKEYNGNWVGTKQKTNILDKNNKPIGQKYMYNYNNNSSIKLESALLDE